MIICIAFFIDFISLEPISNYLVGDEKFVFVVTLEPNDILMYVHVLPSISASVGVVSEIIQQMFQALIENSDKLACSYGCGGS